MKPAPDRERIVPVPTAFHPVERQAPTLVELNRARREDEEDGQLTFGQQSIRFP
jgi:hypothetical protein